MNGAPAPQGGPNSFGGGLYPFGFEAELTAFLHHGDAGAGAAGVNGNGNGNGQQAADWEWQQQVQ